MPLLRAVRDCSPHLSPDPDSDPNSATNPPHGAQVHPNSTRSRYEPDMGLTSRLWSVWLRMLLSRPKAASLGMEPA